MGESKESKLIFCLFISIDASNSREHTRSNVELSAPDFYYSLHAVVDDAHDSLCNFSRTLR